MTSLAPPSLHVLRSEEQAPEQTCEIESAGQRERHGKIHNTETTIPARSAEHTL